MNKLMITLLSLSLTVTAWAQDSEKRSVDSFSGVRASTGIDVYLKKGSKESVEVEATNIDLDKVITKVSGETLKIYIDNNKKKGSIKVKVYVTFVELDEISASSAAGIYGESVIKGKSLELSASSAADIELEIEVEDLEVDVSSAGDIELEGTAESLEAEASSAGELDAYDLKAGNVEARASSGGTVKVFATSSIEARASSGGSVRYRGNPKKSNSSSSSGGSVRKTND